MRDTIVSRVFLIDGQFMLNINGDWMSKSRNMTVLFYCICCNQLCCCSHFGLVNVGDGLQQWRVW